MEYKHREWFAVHVRSNCEYKVAGSLRNKGYDCLLPSYKPALQRSEGGKEGERPLFAGYVFCRFDPSKRLPILITPGVVRVLGIGKTPVAVKETEIAAIQAVMRSGVAVRPCQFLEIGRRVRVTGGPLAGSEGILLNYKKGCRLVVSVSLLQRSIAIEICQDSVEAIEAVPPVEAMRPMLLRAAAWSQSQIPATYPGAYESQYSTGRTLLRPSYGEQ